MRSCCSALELQFRARCGRCLVGAESARVRRGYADLPQATIGSPLYVLAFGIGGNHIVNASAYSIWSTAGPCSIVFAASAGCYELVDMLGEGRTGGKLCTEGGLLRVDNVTDAPLIAKRER